MSSVSWMTFDGLLKKKEWGKMLCWLTRFFFNQNSFFKFPGRNVCFYREFWEMQLIIWAKVKSIVKFRQNCKWTEIRDCSVHFQNGGTFCNIGVCFFRFFNYASNFCQMKDIFIVHRLKETFPIYKYGNLKY